MLATNEKRLCGWCTEQPDVEASHDAPGIGGGLHRLGMNEGGEAAEGGEEKTDEV